MTKAKFEEFIDFLSSIQLADFSEKAKKQATWNILDTIGAIIAGGQEEEIVQLTRRLNNGARPVSTVLADQFPKMEETWAAFLNGTAGSSLEMDPGHRYAIGHPSIHVFPAILAIGERDRRSGADLLLSYLIGYEAASRLGMACTPKPQFSPHGVFGTVGAAAACAHFAGAKGNLLRQAMNISCSFVVTNSLQNTFRGSTVRNACAGMAGHFGILAWEMAASGFTGLDDAILETFGHLVGENFSYERMLEKLGKPFEIERYYTKLYACCAYIHPTLDALEEIRQREAFDPQQIKRILVRTFSPVCSFSSKHPLNPLASRFSVPYAVAVLLIFNECLPKHFSIKALEDPNISALSQKVEVVENPSFTARLPGERCSEVEITLLNGLRLSATLTDHRGSYLQPHSDEELKSKFFCLTKPIIGDLGAREVMEEILDIEKIEDVSSLTEKVRHFRKSP